MAEPNTEQSILEEGIPVLNFEISPSQVIYAPVDKTLSISEMPADAKATGEAIANLAADISDLEEEISEITGMTYPVGSIYMTVNDHVPESFGGVWKEILLPMTWSDLKKGTRSHTELEEGQDPARTVHFFLRIE